MRLSAALSPLLVAGFALLREIDGTSGRSGSGRRSGWLATVGGWGVLAVGCRHLPLSHVEPLVAAAGVLLLAAWLVAELPSLLRRLDRSNEIPPRVFFLLPLLAYIAVFPWIQTRHTPSGDEPYFLLAAHSLAYDGDLDLADNYAHGATVAFTPHPNEPQARDPVGNRGQIYFGHPPAGALLLALPYRLAGGTGAALLMLALAAGVAWIGLALTRELHPGHPRGQLLAWLALAFGSPLALYSYRIWAEIPAALALATATLLILRLRHQRSVGAVRLLLIAVLLACPVFFKLRFALVSAPLAALSWWWTGRRWRPLMTMGGTVLAATATMLILNLYRFDQLFGKYTPRALDLSRYPVGNWLRGMAGLLLDGAFGLAASFPLWLLVLPGLALTVIHRPISRGLLLAWVPYFLVLLPRHYSFAHYAPPFRYGIAVLPVLAACLVPVFEDRRTSVRAATGALACLTLVLAVVWTVQPAWTVDRVTGTTHLLDRLELLTHSDFGRSFPSYMRQRTAAWVWAGVVLVLAVSWRWWPSRLKLRGLAPALLLSTAATTAWVAGHAPTRTVEFEDRWVEHREGEEFPAPWEPWAQPRAWRLATGESVRVPLVPGGSRLLATLCLGHPDGPGRRVALELITDDGHVLAWNDELDAHAFWQCKTLPPVSLPSIRPAGLTVRAKTPVVLDRAQLRWIAESPPKIGAGYSFRHRVSLMATGRSERAGQRRGSHSTGSGGWISIRANSGCSGFRT